VWRDLLRQGKSPKAGFIHHKNLLFSVRLNNQVKDLEAALSLASLIENVLHRALHCIGKATYCVGCSQEIKASC
jgi:hypothetical protein